MNDVELSNIIANQTLVFLRRGTWTGFTHISKSDHSGCWRSSPTGKYNQNQVHAVAFTFVVPVLMGALLVRVWICKGICIGTEHSIDWCWTTCKDVVLAILFNLHVKERKHLHFLFYVWQFPVVILKLLRWMIFWTYKILGEIWTIQPGEAFDKAAKLWVYLIPAVQWLQTSTDRQSKAVFFHILVPGLNFSFKVVENNYSLFHPWPGKNQPDFIENNVKLIWQEFSIYNHSRYLLEKITQSITRNRYSTDRYWVG